MREASSLEELHALANTVRRVYNLLRHTTDQLHAETGITAPKRTLLMDLHRYGPQTVPALAGARCISRQIIQTQVNDLKKAGLLKPKSNPEHRRSKLIALTKSGQRTVNAMIEVENTFLKELGWLPERKDLHQCREVLESIYQRLSENSATG
ncbi:MAG: MarR family winged helix-turn-helix transcriptional regulator [Opitutales bacterium]